MSDEPLVWHYGLMAQVWAEFLVETPELSFLQNQIRRSGQPVLDLACGTGRLLLPLLQAGIDIDGCDISPDMLQLCRQKAQQAGLSTRVSAQPMHAFALDRAYRTIFICGSFGLAGSREQNLETLRRCHHHLAAGGALIFNIEAEYTLPDAWGNWLADKRQELPQDWPAEGKSRRTSAGIEYVSRFRLLELDPLEQSYLRQVRLEKWQAGEMVASEEYTLRGYMFFRNEIELMLRLAGFREIAVYGDYTERPATADHSELLFVASR